MNYLSEKRFAKRATLWVLLLVTLPQVLRILLNYIYAYEVEGNLDYDTLGTVLNYAVYFLGPVSFFAGIGAVIYLTFLYGMHEGGEWILALYGAYGLAYLLLRVISNYTFGLVAYAFVAAATVFSLFAWLKSGKRPSALVAATLVLPLFGGMMILFSASVPTVDEILENALYAMANLSFEMLFLVTAGRIANALRERVLGRVTGKDVDIAIGRRFLPWQNPILAAFALTDLLYALLLSIDRITFTAETVKEYGWPVNSSEWVSFFYPYLELVALFVVGYAMMLLIGGRIESAFLATNQETASSSRRA